MNFADNWARVLVVITFLTFGEAQIIGGIVPNLIAFVLFLGAIGYFLFLFSLEFESFSNVVLIKPWKSPKAEAIPNITIKLKPATIVTIQVPVPILSGTANKGLGIQKSITNKITLMSFGYLTIPSVNKEINNPKDS